MSTFSHLVLAWTLYLESASQGEFGVHLTANVIRNRMDSSGRSAESVCFKARTFSCWNFAGDKKKWIEDQIRPVDPAFDICWQKAGEILSNRLEKVTGATHYHKKDAAPYWSKRMKFCTAYKDHVFLR